MSGRYPLATDSFGEQEHAALQEVLASGQFSMAGRVRAFEEAFAAFLGVRHCVMVNSGSSANLIMAAALRYRSRDPLRPGDEVIVPAVGWATTYFPFHQQGFRLRFCDVDPDTLNLDPAALAAAITPATRAVCTVDVLGNPCDYAAIEAAIAGRDIVLVEDACEAMGAAVGGRACGTHGLMGSFSFFFSHHISTMEGGMIATDDDELAEVATCLRAHGWTRDLPVASIVAGPRRPDPFDERFRFVLPGYNVRPLELSAAVGLVQLRRFDAFLAQRRANADRFRQAVAGIPWLRPQREHGASSWFGLAMTVDPAADVTRRALVDAFGAAGIDCRPIVTGNFARQEALVHLDHSIAGALDGADRVHDHGLFVGNGERDLSREIDHLATTLRTVRTMEVAA